MKTGVKNRPAKGPFKSVEDLVRGVFHKKTANSILEGMEAIRKAQPYFLAYMDGQAILYKQLKRGLKVVAKETKRAGSRERVKKMAAEKGVKWEKPNV